VKKPSAIPEIGVVMSELVTVVGKRERRGQRSVKGSESSEVGEPLFVTQSAEADAGRPAIITPAQTVFRKIGRRHNSVKAAVKLESAALRSIGGSCHEDSRSGSEARLKAHIAFRDPSEHLPVDWRIPSRLGIENKERIRDVHRVKTLTDKVHFSILKGSCGLDLRGKP
jgi:hypothetical protein